MISSFPQRNQTNVDHNYWVRGIAAYTFDTSGSVPTVKDFGAYDMHWHYTDLIAHINSTLYALLIYDSKTCQPPLTSHARTHERTHARTHAHKHTHTLTHARTHTHTHTHKQTNIHSQVPTHINKHTKVCTCTHARAHTHTHTQTNKQANVCTHTHTHALVLLKQMVVS